MESLFIIFFYCSLKKMNKLFIVNPKAYNNQHYLYVLCQVSSHIDWIWFKQWLAMLHQLKRRVTIQSPAAFVWRSMMMGSKSLSSSHVITLCAQPALRYIVFLLCCIILTQSTLNFFLGRRWLIVQPRQAKFVAPSAKLIVYFPLKALNFCQLMSIH